MKHMTSATLAKHLMAGMLFFCANQMTIEQTMHVETTQFGRRHGEVIVDEHASELQLY